MSSDRVQLLKEALVRLTDAIGERSRFSAVSDTIHTICRQAEKADSGKLYKELSRALGGLYRRRDELLKGTAESIVELSYVSEAIGVMEAHREHLKLRPKEPNEDLDTSPGLTSERQREICRLLHEAQTSALTNSQLAEQIGCKLSSVSRTLRELRAKGFVRSAPFGRRTANTITKSGVAELQEKSAPSL